MLNHNVRLIVFCSWVDKSGSNCIQFNVSAHERLQSLVEIKTMSFSKVTLLQEVVTVTRDYQTLPIYESMSSTIATEGGTVVMKDQTLLTILVRPLGLNENGHSLICCFE